MARRTLTQRELLAVTSAIQYIADTYDLTYWNQNQREPNGSFAENVGVTLITPAFEARSYVWSENSPEAELPNFKYKDLEVSWYKHLGRGMSAELDVTTHLDATWIGTMMQECREAIEASNLKG